MTRYMVYDNPAKTKKGKGAFTLRSLFSVNKPRKSKSKKSKKGRKKVKGKKL